RTATVTFIAASGGTSVGAIELQVENNNQLSDGKGKVILVTKAYDKKGGTALSGVVISLISTSLNAKFEKTEGTTNELGEFRTSVTSDVAESFQVTAVKKDSTDANLRSTQTVVFLPQSSLQPKSIVLNALNNNMQVNEEVELVVIARDANNSPMAGVPIIFSTSTGDVLPDVSGSARFTSDMSKTETDNTGSVKVKITNNEPGTFKVKATVKGSSLSSEVVLTFNKSSTTQTPVESLELLTSSPELKSEGDANGVIITARVKDANNNLMSGKKVSFTTDSGSIQAVAKKNDAQTGVTYDPAADGAGVTDATGQAYARLTTTGDPANRKIEVKATSESKTTSITVNVIGTKIKITGSDAIVMGSESTLNIALTDSADKGIAAQVEVSADNGSLINGSSTPVVVSTDNKGLVDVKLNAVQSGATVVTVKKVKDNKPRAEDEVSATWSINVSQDDFTIVGSQTPDADGIYNLPISAKSGSSGCLPPYIGCEPPQGAITFKVVWKSSGQPKQGGEVKLSTTRGVVTPQTGVTDANGELSFAVTSDTAGPGVVTATTTTANGPSKSIPVYFTATDVASMVLQAAPSTVGINVSGGNEQQSKISALLRDKDGNVVKGKRIVFRVEDITGGSVSPSSGITDASGQASITYYAGGSPSANGVTVYARVGRVNSIYCTNGQTNSAECAVNLTVALKKVFITLGTGNKIGIYNTTTYAYPYTVLITDINEAPVQNEQVILSINTIAYAKGFQKWTGKTWLASYTVNCLSEDNNINGLLDSGEDNNGDGILTPGNVATFSADSTSVVENNSIALKTGKDGLAAFSIIYPKNHANWVVIQLTARAGESTAFNSPLLPAATEDMTTQDADPPGRVSPFGRGGPPTDPDNSKIDVESNYPNASCNNTL
ncbi:MAG: Ig-like domain-containing protein, partial [Thiotrichaceae bacterium]